MNGSARVFLLRLHFARLVYTDSVVAQQESLLYSESQALPQIPPEFIGSGRNNGILLSACVMSGNFTYDETVLQPVGGSLGLEWHGDPQTPNVDGLCGWGGATNCNWPPEMRASYGSINVPTNPTSVRLVWSLLAYKGPDGSASANHTLTAPAEIVILLHGGKFARHSG
jgi:hypothetical protein